MGPLVSVLMPVRDVEATIDRALQSLKQQSFGDFEVLLIDDGSKDQTAARALPYGVKLLEGEGKGIVHALNLGLKHARGALIARMDGDDESLPARLQRQVERLQREPKLAGCGTGVEIFRDDRPVSPNLQRYAAWLNAQTTVETLFNDRFVESPLCHPSVMLRRDALEQVGGWRDEDVPEDWELWLRMLAQGHSLVCLDEVLFRWRDHDRRLTRTDARYGLERHLRLKARYLLPWLRGKTPLTVWGAGEIGLKLSRLLRAGGLGIERFIELNPRKIGQKIEGVKVVSPDEISAPHGHLLAAVGAKGARAEIRSFLAARGFREGEHFTCAA